MSARKLPVAIIGAGPVGLAAAAELLARGETPVVLEAGGAIAHSVREWGHVRMFSPWRYNVDRAARLLLEAAGWQHPDEDAVPTGGELVRDYLEPLAALPVLARHIHLNSRVTAVTRKNCDKVQTAGREQLPFVLRVKQTNGAAVSFEARAVIDTSGTWTSPNPAGADGLPAIGEDMHARQIASGIPDVLGAARARYAGKTVAVVGGGHSALNVLIDLARLQTAEPATRIIWLMRKARIEAAYGGEEADGLPARGALGSQARRCVESGAVDAKTPFRIARISHDATSRLVIQGDYAGHPGEVIADELINTTGFRPDMSFLREMRLSLDPALECAEQLGTLIDPNLHSCGTVRAHGAFELAHAEPDFYIAGMKSYGRAPTFLLATGHEQVRSIAAALMGDMAAARRVELELPETGVCSASPSDTLLGLDAVGAGCCGGPPKLDAGSCCTRDEDVKAETGKGCGSGTQSAPTLAPVEMAPA